MEENKHTVTVPMEDYIKMKEAYDSINEMDGNISRHLSMMNEVSRKSGIYIEEWDITREPKDIHVTPDMMNNRMRVFFEYPAKEVKHEA